MRRRCERGAVTAELALGLPLLLAVTLGLVWLLAAASAQVRVVDAAREAARVAARGDGLEQARAVGRRIAPEDARVEVATSGGEVRVDASAHIDGPGGLFDFLPGVIVRASAVTVAEETR